MNKYNIVKDNETNTTINILHDDYNKKINSENSNFMNNQKLITNKKINDQDDALDILEKGIDRLKQKSMEIGDEIKQHSVMLDKLDNNINDSSYKIEKINLILGKIKKNIDKCSFLWIIIFLGVLLFVMICLIIWS